MDVTMLLLLALFPAAISVLLFVGTVRLQPAARRTAPEIVDSTPLGSAAQLDPVAVAQALGTIPIRDRALRRAA